MSSSLDIVKFTDRHVRPPRGQWSFPIQGELVTRYSEGEIIGEIRKWRQNNGTYIDDAAIERELWEYYCSRETKRCAGYQPRASQAQAVAPIVPRELTPEVQGPWIWQALNMAAVKFRKDFFLTLCDEVSFWLECPKCRNEWRSLLQEDPPEKLTSAKEACAWINKQHNRVNRRIGKAEFPYTEMVKIYGAPL